MILLLGVVVALYVLVGFAREEYWMWLARDDRGIHLLAEPRVLVFRDERVEHDDRIGWTLFYSGEPDNGIRVVSSFTSWPLATVAPGFFIYAAVSIFEWSDKRAV